MTICGRGPVTPNQHQRIGGDKGQLLCHLNSLVSWPKGCAWTHLNDSSQWPTSIYNSAPTIFTPPLPATWSSVILFQMAMLLWKYLSVWMNCWDEDEKRKEPPVCALLTSEGYLFPCLCFSSCALISLSWTVSQSDFSHWRAPLMIQHAQLAEKPPTKAD